MSDLQCPYCGGNESKNAGFHTLTDGTRMQRYQCCCCKKKFQPKYLRPPAQPAEMDCPHCGSSRTVIKGNPIKRKHGKFQPCICKDCGKNFSQNKSKLLKTFLNGKLIHSCRYPPGLEYIPDVACPNCYQKKAMLKTKYKDSQAQREVLTLVCLGCGQQFKGEGRPWKPTVYRMLGKPVPSNSWLFENERWDLRELYPNVEEQKFKQFFLNFTNCGFGWYKNLLKAYVVWCIQVGIKYSSLPDLVSSLKFFGRFLQVQGVTLMENINRQFMATYWMEERGNLARNSLLKEMAHIQSFLHWGNAQQHFTTSSSLITSFDRPKKFLNEPDPLEDSVLETIRDNLHILPEPLQLMFMLGFWLGTRPSELCYLYKDCLKLDLDGSNWWVEFEREKAEDNHKLLVTTDLIRLIQQQQVYINELFGEDYPYLFCHYQQIGDTSYPNYAKLKAVKRPPIVTSGNNPMVKAIRHIIKHCEIKDSNGRLATFTGNILRPSRATHLINNGFSLEFVRLWLKHRQAETTRRHYTRYRPGELLDVATVMANLDGRLYPYDSDPQSLRQNSELHELDGLTMLNGEPLYGYCTFRDFCPRFGRCYSCGFHVASADKLDYYKSQLERLKIKEQFAFNHGSSEILESYKELVNALENIIDALEAADE